GILGQEIDPRRACDPTRDRVCVGVGSRDQGLESAQRFRPLQGVEIVFNAQHRRGVNGLALEDTFVELATLGHAKDLWQWPSRLVALEPCDGARGEDQHAVCRFTPKCLLPGKGHDIELRPIQGLRESSRRGVADCKTVAIGSDPISIWNAYAGGSSVPRE